MASTIKIKNSSTASAVPTSSDLVQGELAVNVTDKRVFTENASGTVVELGINPSSLTLANGTANGVAYLNGSKVLTTGSALVFDGSNLGLGVTPSAWNSNYKAIEMSFGALMGNTTGVETNLTSNVYRATDGSYKYMKNGVAGMYTISDGSARGMAWYTAASGTAGNAITFTQAMTLDASGNLGIGVTSPTDKLAVGGRLSFGAVTAEADMYGMYVSSATGNSTTIASFGATNLCFRTNNTERARIDSSGNLLVGTTSTVNASKQVILFPGNTQNGSSIQTSQNTSGAVFQYFLDNAGATCGSITRVGTTSAVLYNTSSDCRLKENISDADSASSLIESLQVRKFDWKADGSHQRYGFIAQELVTVAPEAVHQPKDTDEMMAVDYSKLVPMLVKEIQSLRQRLAAAGI